MKKNLISFILTFMIVFAQFGAIPVFADKNADYDLVSVHRSVSGSEFKVGQKIDVNYTITPEIIPVTNMNSDKEKDVVLVVDTSGSMSDKVKNSSKTKLQVVKNVIKNFYNKFKDNKKINLSLIGYSNATNFIYSKEILYKNINKKNIREICKSLQIDTKNIYYKYNHYSYKVNNKLYKYDIKSNNEYYYDIDLNMYPDVNELDFYYHSNSNGSFIKIDDVCDIVLANMEADGGTNIGDGLRNAYYMLNNNNGHDKYIILMTDGFPTAFTAKIGYTKYTPAWYSDVHGEIYRYSQGYLQFINKFRNLKSTEFEKDRSVNDVNYVVNYNDNDDKGFALYYANEIGKLIADSGNIKTFIVGFGSDANKDSAVMKNMQIAKSAYGKYYNALNEHEINEIYDKIGNIVEVSKSAKIYFEEKIPYGLSISKEDIDKLPIGLKIEGNKIVGDLKDEVFYQKVKDRNGNVIGLRANPISFNITYKAIKENENCIFKGQPDSFIKYMFKDNGKQITKYFEPIAIKIKRYIEKKLVNAQRYITDIYQEEQAFNVKYRIVPEKIDKNNVFNNDRKKDVVLILDTSASMNYDIYGYKTYKEYNKRLSIMKNTAVKFINKLSEDKNIRIGLIQYNREIVDFIPVSNGNKDSLIRKINSMNAEGSTNIGEGLRKAYSMLCNDSNRDKYIVLMSDGFPTAFTAKRGTTNYLSTNRAQESIGKVINGGISKYFKSLNSTTFAYINPQKVEYVINFGENDECGFSLQYAMSMGNIIRKSSQNIKTFVIGFSNGINSEKLQKIADSSGGKYFEALDEECMNNVYNSIEKIVKADINASLHFEENIGENIKIIDKEKLPYGLNVKDGKLIGNINNIYYTLDKNGTYFEAKPIEFNVNYKSLNSGYIRLGQNDSSFVEYKLSIGKYERNIFKPIELYVPDIPKITQDDMLYNGKVKVSITGDRNSIIEYRFKDQKQWKEYREPLYLDIDTLIYARCKSSHFVSKEVNFMTYNPNAKAISTFTRNLPDKIALSSEYEIKYTFNGNNVKYDIKKPLEIVLILNTSLTMKDNLAKLKEAAISFIDNLPKDREVKVGIVRYYGFGDIVSELTDIRNTEQLNILKEKISDIEVESGTNLGEALRLGYQLLNNGSDANKHFVIMSDGYANVGIVKKDSKYNSGWENATYIDNLDTSINNQIKKEELYTRIGLQGVKRYINSDTDGDGLLDRFNIGHKYVTVIANKINESNLNINTHIIHFKRVSGAGDDIAARKNNNEVATLLGVTKEVKPGQKFYLAENADEIKRAFNDIAGVIQDSISFNKVEFSEKFPQGVEVLEYPNGLTYDKHTNTLHGTIRNVRMCNVNKDLKLYRVQGEFSIKIKFNQLGEKVFNEGEVKYIEPFSKYEKSIKCKGGRVHVLDNSKLSIKQITIVSNNPNNSNRAKVGDVITILIEANKEIYKPVVTILGNSADDVVKVNNDNKKWKACYTMRETDAEGKVRFDIQLKDKWIDDNINVNYTTDGSQVIFDKTPPTVTLEYSTLKMTNGNVIATIKKQYEDFKVINNNGSRNYTFTENGKFIFRFEDETGNIGECVAIVNWIDKEGPEASITYTPNTLTNKDVVAVLKSNENIIITNNNGDSSYKFTDNGKFTFEFKDMAGNTSSKTAEVDWIDKETPNIHVEYSTTELTNSDVVAVLVPDKDEREDFIVTNNNGLKKYTFTENGEFTFEYRDRAGNIGSTTAKVDWIYKEDILEHGAWINGRFKKMDKINIVRNIPTELATSLRLASNNTSITLSFDKSISGVKLKLLDFDGNEVTDGIKKSFDKSDNKYTITCSKALKGQYYLLYDITALIPDDKVNATIDIDSMLDDVTQINILDLPNLE